MINEVVTERVLEMMTEIAATDPEAVRRLIEARVPCNETLAQHPTVQVGRISADDPRYEVGLLGILNGLCGTFDRGPKQGWGPIRAIVEDDGNVRFERTSSPEIVEQ